MLAIVVSDCLMKH